MTENTTDVTENLPTMDPSTRTKVKKWTTYGVFAAGALLLIDDQVKKFRSKRKVTVTVADTDES